MFSRAIVLNNKMKKKYYLAFDQRIICGSVEHYYHFIWGYLFPSIHAIYTLTDSDNSKYLFRSCGPVMDELIKEVMQLCHYDFSIIPTGSEIRFDDYNKIIVQRWDIGFYRSLLLGDEELTYVGRIMLMREELKQHKELFDQFSRHNFTSELSLSIGQLRSHLLQRVNELDDNGNFDQYKKSYLLLKRSACPDFYEKDGKSEASGYGISRRGLLGVEDVAKVLRQKNISVQVFEPGKYSLIEQIRVFFHCKGVVGIEGAEFANIIWLKANSKVILIHPVALNLPPIIRLSAELLSHDYIQVDDDQGYYPVLGVETIEKHLVVN
jgi:hypothetical protein